MALSLRQKTALLQNSNAQARVQAALLAAADTVSVEELPPDATEAQSLTFAKRAAFASILYEYASSWVPRCLTRIVGSAAVSQYYLQLQGDSNALSAEDSDAMDAALIAAVMDIYTTLANLV